MTLLHDNGVSTPLDDEYFHRAESQVLEWIDSIHSLMADDAALRADLGRLKRDREVIEQEWWRDGLVTGSNAEARQNTLALLRRESRPYQALTLDLEVTESNLAMVQRDLERAREMRSLSKRRLEFAIATRQWHAAGTVD
ncbi:MAG: hypothetical protein AB7R89_05980 [Dehalococcoidia bacterium]